MTKNNKDKQTVYFYSKDPKKDNKISSDTKERIKKIIIIILLFLAYITRFTFLVFIALIISFTLRRKGQLHTILIYLSILFIAGYFLSR